MTVPVVAFFNNKGGVGKTSLVFHLSWMLGMLGHRVVVADLDPQANLTAAYLDDDALEDLWQEPMGGTRERSRTVFASLQPLIRGVGDVSPTQLRAVVDDVWLLPGDLGLAGFEDELSSQWPDCLDAKERAFRVTSAFSRLLATAAAERRAGIVLVDVGPNLGAINRSALVAADHVVFPLAPDLFSVQGLRNLGPTLRRWRGEWSDRLARSPAMDFTLPRGAMEPLGYLVTGHGVREGRPAKSYQRWMELIPTVYRQSVLNQDVPAPAPAVAEDPHCLAQLKHYRSLMPMAQAARRPVFLLKPAHGAFGGHQHAVAAARHDFAVLAQTVLERLGVPAPRSGALSADG